MRTQILLAIVLATELGVVCATSHTPARRLRDANDSRGSSAGSATLVEGGSDTDQAAGRKTLFDRILEAAAPGVVPSTNGTGPVARGTGEFRTGRELYDHLLFGDAFFPANVFDAPTGRCLAGGSKRHDTAGRKGRRVRMKNCKKTVKNKARWNVYPVDNKFVITSVLYWGDGTDCSKQLCLVPRKLEVRGRLEMADCDSIPDSFLFWKSVPENEGEANQDLLRFPYTDSMDLCVNSRAILVPCENDDGLINEEKKVTEYLKIVKEVGVP
mmetsp:Transcript_27400/g.80586  ORF Transcript_27400/g.80586 Transcript_27400/m.80586 type:complete len:270 (-) Transcript_27400:261-1070(-)